MTSTLDEDQYAFLIIFCSIILKLRNVSDKFVEKTKMHFLFSALFFENRSLYEIICKNVADPGEFTDDNTEHAHCMLDTYGYKHSHNT